MPGRMPRRFLLLLCLAAVPAGVAACGTADEQPGVDHPAREGLALELNGVTYNVFITRQLNPRIPPDDAYVEEGTEADQGETLPPDPTNTDAWFTAYAPATRPRIAVAVMLVRAGAGGATAAPAARVVLDAAL